MINKGYIYKKKKKTLLECKAAVPMLSSIRTKNVEISGNFWKILEIQTRIFPSEKSALRIRIPSRMDFSRHSPVS